MDEADYGQQNDEFFRQEALRVHFRRAGFNGTGFNGDTLRQDVPIKSCPRECLDCGDEIGKARMKANPAATRCVECQEKKERKR